MIAESLQSNPYESFIFSKSHTGTQDGFKPTFMPDFLFDFQASLIDWGIRQGRCGMWLNCGLGKTPIGLVWQENCIRHINKPGLYVTPLGVAPQAVREAEKFGIEAKRSRDGTVHPNITVTNYEQLGKFNPNDFGSIVCDESAVIKDMKGVLRKQVTDFARKIRYRLFDTATVAPNNYVEFGTASEALGYLGNQDMLSEFFTNAENSTHPMWIGSQWRFKAHAETMFWRWLCSWGRAARKPSDLGFDDRHFILPPLDVRETVVENQRELSGSLFVLPAVTLNEQREERRMTIDERCGKVAELFGHDEPAVAWCHLNAEGETLERMIPGAVNVQGGDSDEFKEEMFLSFSSGQLKKLVTKPTIGGFGLNWQHCSHMSFFPSHSFEQYYQSVRRCYRFGQESSVRVDIVTTEGELGVLKNLQKKSDAADVMFSSLIHHMNNALSIDRSVTYKEPTPTPSWL